MSAKFLSKKCKKKLAFITSLGIYYRHYHQCHYHHNFGFCQFFSFTPVAEGLPNFYKSYALRHSQSFLPSSLPFSIQTQVPVCKKVNSFTMIGQSHESCCHQHVLILILFFKHNALLSYRKTWHITFHISSTMQLHYLEKQTVLQKQSHFSHSDTFHTKKIPEHSETLPQLTTGVMTVNCPHKTQ